MHNQDTIYVLRLSGGKWYVGKTSNVNLRFAQHLCGKGARWTFLHKPLVIHELRRNKSGSYEDDVTREYMRKYGINNVRGGKYCMVEMRDSQIGNIAWGFQTEDFTNWITRSVRRVFVGTPSMTLTQDADGKWIKAT